MYVIRIDFEITVYTGDVSVLFVNRVMGHNYIFFNTMRFVLLKKLLLWSLMANLIYEVVIYLPFNNAQTNGYNSVTD